MARRQKVGEGSPEAKQRSDWTSSIAKQEEQKRTNLAFEEKDWFFGVGLQMRNRDTPLSSLIKEQHASLPSRVGLRRRMSADNRKIR